MSNPLKKRAYGDDPMNRDDGSSGSSDSDDDSNPDIYTGNEEIQVDFEGRNPQDSDFHGIKALLQQLFLKAHVNLSELSNIIIGQSNVGSVIKQSEPDMAEDDMDEEYNDANDVFGITTAVSLQQRMECESIQQIRKLLTDLAEEHASPGTRAFVERVLASRSALLLSERLVNIPPQISVPLFDSLHTELEKAQIKNDAYNFDYFVMICKMYKADPSKRSKKSKSKEPLIIYSNAEEEVILGEASDSFEFTVTTEKDSGLTGNWLEEDKEMVPCRKVLILEGKKLPKILEVVKAFIA